MPAVASTPLGSTFSNSRSHIAAGRQNRSSTSNPPRAQSELMMSVSCGPTKFDMRNWTEAKTPPTTTTAGHTSSMPRHPTMMQTR